MSNLLTECSLPSGDGLTMVTKHSLPKDVASPAAARLAPRGDRDRRRGIRQQAKSAPDPPARMEIRLRVVALVEARGWRALERFGNASAKKVVSQSCFLHARKTAARLLGFRPTREVEHSR